ncbi:VCBS repeat-containing protein [soil metagenome]
MPRVSQAAAATLAVALLSSPPLAAEEPEDSPTGTTAVALAPRIAEPPEGTRFERIDLPFVNSGSPQRTDEDGRVIFFATSSGRDTAGGVAVGDYDGDGHQDVFLTRSQGGSRLFRNLGDLRFEDATEAAGLAGLDGHWSTGCSFVDIDNDGHLDLAVCGFNSPNLIFRNNRDGTFTECGASLGLDFVGASIMLAFADYDLDGDLDAFLLTNYLERPDDREPVKLQIVPATGQVVVPPDKRESIGAVRLADGTLKTFRSGQADRLFRNDGGTFTDVTETSGIAGFDTGLGAVWWDYNRDGWPDLYVANDFHGPDRWYRNNRDGTFTDVIRQMVGHTPWFSMGVDTADINNDGLPDLFATDMAGTDHYKDKIGMGDMDESAWFLNYAEPRQYMRNALYLNSGTPRFMEINYLADVGSSDWTWSPNFGDLDNDGLIDLFVTNGMTRDLFHSDLKRQEAEIMASRDRERAARFWADKPPKNDRNIAFRNRDGLRFEKVGKDWGLDHLGVSFGSAVADLDNDGDLDIVVNNFGEPASIFHNRSASPCHSIEIALAGRQSNRSGIGATVEVATGTTVQMRTLTLARGYMSSPGTRLHFGLGEHDSADSVTVFWPGGRIQVVEDLAADHLYTLVEPEQDVIPEAPPAPAPPPVWFRATAVLQDAIHAETPFDDFARQPLLPNKLSQLGPGMAWADFDGDGHVDLALSGAAGMPAQLWRNEGGHFSPVEAPALAAHSASEDMAPLFFDADADGHPDLYIVSGGVEAEPGDPVFRDRLYLNDGSGNFTPAPEGSLPDLTDSGSVVAAADFDRDGDLDLFVGGRSVPGRFPELPASRLLRNDGSGTFTDVTADLAPDLARSGLVTSALWSDADGDGWPDLLVTHEWGSVRIFRNAHGSLVETTEAAGLAPLLGWWNGIAGRDLDGDGDIDYVATNLGRNTKYRPSPERPEILYYADLDSSGRADLVEATFEGDVLYPRRGFSCSSNAMPFIRDKMQTFNRFASASLTDVYPAEALQEATRLEATTADSGVFLNDGSGRFTFAPLPLLAQVSPSFGLVLADFNGDAIPDIVLGQNFYHPQPETVRMDGGLSLLLQGLGDGTFHPVLAAGSGIVVAGDATAVAATDLDGDGRPDLAIATNDGSVLTFLNSSASNSLGVRLLGRPGNPTAIGARLTVSVSGLPDQSTEIHAGGGYLSQSSPTAFFTAPADPHELTIEIRWPDGAKSTHPLATLPTPPLLAIPQEDPDI